MNYLLDTNICIALLKGKEGSLINRMKEKSPTDFYLCSVVKGELLYGAHKSHHVQKNLSLLTLFFEQFQSLPFDDRCSDFYGSLRFILEKSGQIIGANDLLIASIAQVNQLTLLTRNAREFVRVPGLKWEEW